MNSKYSFPHKIIMLPISDKQIPSQRFKAVLQMANENCSKIILVSVIDDLDAYFGYLPNKSSFDLLGKIEQATLNHLQLIETDLSGLYPKIHFEVRILIGKPFVKLIELAAECDVELIVLDALHDGIKNKTEFSSLTKHLMRKAGTPVWAVSSRFHEPVRKIVAAIDVSDDSSEVEELNQNIVSSAHELSMRLDAKLSVFHAWRLYGESYLSGRGGKSKLEIAVLAKEEKQRRQAQIMALLDGLGIEISEVDVQLEEGHAEAVLPEYVNMADTDLLVMGTQCRTGIPGFLIGNTAESMLDTVNCSVITLKPGGFKSPVLQAIK